MSTNMFRLRQHVQFDGTVDSAPSSRQLRLIRFAVRYRIDAISEEARTFYLALGFDPCPREPTTLVVTLADIRAALK